jgi:hypothetical protein
MTAEANNRQNILSLVFEPLIAHWYRADLGNRLAFLAPVVFQARKKETGG